MLLENVCSLNLVTWLILRSRLRIHWKLSTILKTSNKSIWSNVFWYVKVHIFWKFIQYTIHWEKTQMSKKFPSDKINVTKIHSFFKSRAPTYTSYTFWVRARVRITVGKNDYSYRMLILTEYLIDFPGSFLFIWRLFRIKR